MVELFIGITTWNDAFFFPTCLKSIQYYLDGIVEYKICVVDNESTDDSRQIALDFGCQLIVKTCSQADALNMLLNRSSGKYTLLLHSDIALLSKSTWPLIHNAIENKIVLVSPEDIGVGEYGRKSYGAGMPESSFMLWKTEEACRLRSIRVYGNWGLRNIVHHPFRFLPRYRFDFYGSHITHRIPALIERNGLDWLKMNVHPSPKLPEPWFVNNNTEALWEKDWGCYEYGFGNFYSIENTIIHYHNWFTRDISEHKKHLTLNRDRVSMEYIRAYTERFIRDFENKTVHIL